MSKLINVLSSKCIGSFCFIGGLIWFLMLSQNEFSFKTYMSENALLVGLIKNRISESIGIDEFFNNAKKLKDDDKAMFNWIKWSMEDFGLEVGVQNFTFRYDKLFGKQEFTGQNLYGIIRSPAAARSQAILVTVPLSSSEKKSFCGSIATALAVAKHSRYAIYWGMDLIFLFPDMEYVGMKAWLNSYHGISDDSEYISAADLDPRSGSILAGFNMELEELFFSSLHFRLEGLNGRMPNLDLYNTFVRLSHGLSIPVHLHAESSRVEQRVRMDYRTVKLVRLLTGMWQAAAGSPSGIHGLLGEFQVPALTVAATPSKSHGQKIHLFNVARLIESALRCLNSLQERLHQSFFFYLLTDPMRYISIGVYMGPFGVMCVASLLPSLVAAYHRASADDKALASASSIWSCLVKLLTLGFGVGLATYIGLDYCIQKSRSFNTEPGLAMVIFVAAVSMALLLFCRIKTRLDPGLVVVVKAVILLCLGLFLATLSVLNISMGFFAALLLVPVSIFVQPYTNRFAAGLMWFWLLATSPISVLLCCSRIHQGFSASGFGSTLELASHWLVQAWVERDVLAAWTVGIATLGYLPFWAMFCGLLCLRLY